MESGRTSPLSVPVKWKKVLEQSTLAAPTSWQKTPLAQRISTGKLCILISRPARPMQMNSCLEIELA